MLLHPNPLRLWGWIVMAGLTLFLAGCTTGRVRAPLPPVSAVGSPDFAQTTGSLLGASYLPGNKVTALNDGSEIFPAMLAAIRNAKRTITFETYVFSEGVVAQQFVDALTERARAGVEVKVILDAIGSIRGGVYHKPLRDAGVQLAIFRPLLSPDFWRISYRTHRKLLVVDGKVGFIGGVGIADEWSGHPKGGREWRELQYQLEGPAVAQMQAIFHNNWFRLRDEVLLGPGYFPELKPVGKAQAGVFFSAPQRGRYAIGLMYHLAIAGARKSLLIENAYFVPTQPLTDALCAAARRGVKVQIILPGRHIDFSVVRMASRRRWPQLRAAGVEIYEFRDTMLHSKLMIVDDLFVSVGSANFDPRSLAINDEANLNVLDRTFALRQKQIFESDRRRSRLVRYKPDLTDELLDLPWQILQAPIEPQL
jgi:cardiolipin synthase